MVVPSKKLLVPLAVLLVISLAGCVQLTVHSSVNSEGIIEEYQIQINTSRSVYGFIEQSAEEEGYDSVRDSILSDVDLNESSAQSIEYDEEFDGDRVSMTITLNNFDPTESDRVSIAEQDGNLVYEDTTFVNESAIEEGETNLTRSLTATMSVDYYLTMPGAIVESNADEIDGNTAVWHESGQEAFTDNRIYAVSEQPAIPKLPGFGFGIALVAVVMILFYGVFRTTVE